MTDQYPRKYVCGFLFDYNDKRVVLIRKNKPEWQKGRLNGVGGKIEPGEVPLQAMRREFMEEAGLWINDWKPTITLTGHNNGGWIVHFFCAQGPVDEVKTKTDEKVEIVPARDLPQDVIYNLRWLIPLCLEDGIQFPIDVQQNCHYA